MAYDIAFTNGVVKSRERYLLGDKIERMADSGADEILKILKDSGFGGDIAATTLQDAEALIRAEERAVNEFIKEYAPDKRTAAFLLADYDFHNAEALVKCKWAGADKSKLLSCEGAFAISEIEAATDGRENDLPEILTQTIKDVADTFEKGTANGFTVDCAFKRALFAYKRSVAKDKKLKQILCDAADAANVSSAFRSRDFSLAEQMLVEGGKLPLSQIKALCEMSLEQIEGGDFSPEIKRAAEKALSGKPLTELEKLTADYPIELLNRTRYDMIGKEPFLLYVLKRRAEIANVRIITVSVSAGIDGSRIKEKLRSY